MTDLEKKIAGLEEQLRNQERLASLGMLNAGIAHEIQNPLNFVINFSKLSSKLLKDLGEILVEIDGLLPDEDRQEVQEIMDHLQGNIEKIEENGTRASRIIKGILLYSRGRDDEFVPTDLRTLVHEYVWLSYHAARANHKSFNVTIEECYADNIPPLSVVPQDISRAVLNLVNNACHAVFDRAKSAGQSSYSPVIKINLARQDDWAVLTIEDNGPGIPAAVQAQLFTPFFTTKPAGEGTGLGLSIAKKIIEEKHKGKITVETCTDRYTRFIISLPIYK